MDAGNRAADSKSKSKSKSDSEDRVTLSGLLNFIDGLWSSCGDERIIVFTTNHRDRLDPALLRPGRMDVHIHLSYCTASGFRILASNYLGIAIDNRHRLCGEVEGLIASTEVTPAEVAEELMKSDDADFALQGLVNLLKWKNTVAERKKLANQEATAQETMKIANQEATEQETKIIANQEATGQEMDNKVAEVPSTGTTHSDA